MLFNISDAVVKINVDMLTKNDSTLAQKEVMSICFMFRL